MGRGELSAMLASRYVLFSCEGTAEAVVVSRLVETGALAVPRERVVDDPLYFTPYTRLRRADDIADGFFRESYQAGGADGLLVCLSSIAGQGGFPSLGGLCHVYLQVVGIVEWGKHVVDQRGD